MAECLAAYHELRLQHLLLADFGHLGSRRWTPCCRSGGPLAGQGDRETLRWAGARRRRLGVPVRDQPPAARAAAGPPGHGSFMVGFPGTRWCCRRCRELSASCRPAPCFCRPGRGSTCFAGAAGWSGRPRSRRARRRRAGVRSWCWPPSDGIALLNSSWTRPRWRRSRHRPARGPACRRPAPGERSCGRVPTPWSRWTPWPTVTPSGLLVLDAADGRHRLPGPGPWGAERLVLCEAGVVFDGEEVAAARPGRRGRRSRCCPRRTRVPVVAGARGDRVRRRRRVHPVHGGG
ncbi:hypothetical protein SALBM311S_05894 [Streptomyces alboniger]